MVRHLATSKDSPARAPHPRGDGPGTPARHLASQQCSPPAWGWSDHRAPAANPPAVLPTRVGMVRRRLRRGSRSGSAPHPRGDGPGRLGAMSCQWRCSPPAWGWSAQKRPPPPRRQVLPTRVGMVHPPSCRSQVRAGAPHPRGDGPRACIWVAFGSPCSPPAWGWSAAQSSALAWRRVLPTRVGMVRLSKTDSGYIASAPHPRGDGPAEPGNRHRRHPCSPPAWGWSAHILEIDSQIRVLPTRVGMVRRAWRYLG